MRAVALGVVLLCACGPLGPPRADSGTGGGSAVGGGTGSTGGGLATGGGAGTTGGGFAMGGGAGTTGGGSPSDAGLDAGVDGGVDAGLPPLVWSNMALTNATSSSYIIGLSGEQGDLWAVQDTGHLFRSTGGAFVHQFSFDYGAHDVYAAGGMVVILQTRAILTCTSGCTQLSDFTRLDLLNSAINWNLFGETLCGQGTSRVVAIVVNTSNQAQLMEWNGTTWSRTANDLGVVHPRGCWFDAQDRLFVVGQDGVVIEDNGGFTPVSLSSNFTTYTSGVSFGDTNWVVGQQGYVASGMGTTFTKLVTGGGSILWAAGGLSADELYFFGYWSSTNGIGNGFKWNGAQLQPVGNLLPGFGAQSTVRVIHRVSDTELYVAGTNGNGPAIARGRR